MYTRECVDQNELLFNKLIYTKEHSHEIEFWFDYHRSIVIDLDNNYGAKNPLVAFWEKAAYLNLFDYLDEAVIHSVYNVIFLLHQHHLFKEKEESKEEQLGWKSYKNGNCCEHS